MRGSVVGQGTDNEADNGAGRDRGEHRIPAMMVADPVMAGGRRVEAIGMIVGDVDRVLVRPIPAAHMIARRVAMPEIKTIGAAVAGIAVARRGVMPIGPGRRRAMDMARRGPVVMRFGVVAAIVVTIVAMAAMIVAAIPAMVIAPGTVVAMSAVSATMAAIMVSAAAVMVTAPAICISRRGGQKAERCRGRDQRR